MKYKLKIRYIVLCTLLLVVWTTQLIPAMGKIYAHSVYPVIAYILSSFSRLIPFAIGDLFIALSIAGVLGQRFLIPHTLPKTSGTLLMITLTN